MNTYCKIYKLKKDKIGEYIDCHNRIGEGQIRTLAEAGAENLEIYIWNEYCIITYECIEFGKYLKNLNKSCENAEWQEMVNPMFEEMPVFEGANQLKPLKKIFSLKQALDQMNKKGDK